METESWDAGLDEHSEIRSSTSETTVNGLAMLSVYQIKSEIPPRLW